MKKNKGFSSVLSIVLALFVVLGNFSLPVFAYDNGGTNLEQVKTESKTLSSTNGTILNKLNSVSKSTNALQQDLSIIQKGGAVLKKSQQTEVKKDYVEGEILVKYKNSKINLNTNSGRTVALNFNKSKSLEKKEDLRKSNISVLKIKDTKTVEQKIAELKNDPNIEYVEPNYKRYPSDINTNDTNKGLLWGLDNVGQSVNGVSGTSNADINAPEAWAINEGTNSSIIVAVIDGGVAYNHPDLAANMWDGTNCKDENGVAIAGGCNHGYDYEDGDNTPLPTSDSHGTHIAGTIVAVKNNSKGIVGVAPRAKIMAIKYGDDIFSEVQSIDFAIQNGAKVINASFTGPAFSQSELDAINRFRTAGGIFIAAAGNESVNNESVHSYPSDYNLDNIISVAATDQNDTLATFSNYGTTSVDIGAPGTNIYSTVPQETTALFESFESLTPPAVPSGWEGGTSNNWGTYTLDDGSFWGNVLYGDLAYPYANNSNTTITSPTYSLTAGGANIDFWAKCDTEYITNGWVDYMQLEYSADGVNFSIATDPYSGEEFRWDEATFDILNGEDPLNDTDGALFHYQNISIPAQYLTNNFKLRFRWITNSSDNNYDGCLVDDIKITKFSNGSDEQYGYMNGTSMATSHVAGLAALIEGYNPGLTSEQVKDIILTNGDDIPSLHTTTSTGMRINAEKALQAANPAKAITAFKIPSQVGTTTINESAKTIAVTMPYGTDVTNLIASFTTTGASVSIPLPSLPEGCISDLGFSSTTGVACSAIQTSGVTPNNFTSPVTYTVTAADSSTQSYVVTVTVATNTVSGNITTDTIWTLANSPYIVTGTVQVLEGAKLTIEPGVIAKFNSAAGLEILGELIAIGTPDNIITFTSNQIIPQKGDWNNIVFNTSAMGANFDSNNNYINGSAIKYTKIAYAGGGSGNPSIYSNSPALFIDNNTFEFNSGGTIFIDFADSKSVITNNNISNNGPASSNSLNDYYAIKLFFNNISSTENEYSLIKNNNITGNSGGIMLENWINAYVTNNIITNNRAGIFASGTNLKITKNVITDNFWHGIWYEASYAGSGSGNIIQYNDIRNNRTGVVLDNYDSNSSPVDITNNNIYNSISKNFSNNVSSNADINVPNNYWGTIDSSVINTNIDDYYDHIATFPVIGKVIYQPFATAELDFDDQTAPTLAQVTLVTTPTNDNTPNYIFSSNEAGTITYGGSCSSLTTTATAGNNTVSFNTLPDGTYSNCTIKVTDAMGNESLPLSINTFMIDTYVAPATNFTISGIIKYYDGVKIVPNATVILENSVGAQIATTTTDANGAYQFTGVTNGGNYVVRVSKSDNTKGVTSADQTKIGRHIVGLEIFDTIYKKIAGDVNNSGGLTSADQTKIGRFIVGLDNVLTSGNWKFYSSNSTPTISNYLNEGLTRNYTNLIADSPNQDFIGVKMGDVNNSWVSN